MKNVFCLLAILLCFSACNKSENVELIKDFYKAQNNYDPDKLDKLIHNSFSAKLWYGGIIQKDNIVGNVQINKISNYSASISEIKLHADTIALIETQSNDFIEIMGFNKSRFTSTFIIKDDQIFAMQLDTIPGQGKKVIEYEKSMMDFMNWLKDNYPVIIKKDDFDNKKFVKYINKYKKIRS